MRFFARPTLAILAISAPLFASADTPPTDTELRANYCLASALLIQKSLADTALKVPESSRDKLNQKIQRLRAYLLPKILELDPIAMEMARRRADSDFRQVDKETTICFEQAKCSSLKNDPLMFMECASDCPSAESSNRIKRLCQNLDWLPF